MRQHSLLAICVLAFGCTTLSAQNYWKETKESNVRGAGERVIIPKKYKVFTAETADLRDALARAPIEEERAPAESPATIIVPRPDMGFDTFRIVEYRMLDDRLAARYPEIRTFRGVSLNDRSKTLRAQWTLRGFGAVVRGAGKTYFIDPYSRENTEHYVSYFKSDYPQPDQPFTCGVESDPDHTPERDQQRVSGDCTFRSYRLAVATTGEYSNYHGANDSSDEGLVLSEVTIAINRVNDIYEQFVAVRMILIAETTDVFYYNPSTDPYTNSSGSAMLGENQANMDAVIGSPNYDIGHVFSTFGGGIANLRAPCRNTLKARGVTGLPNPVGDPFYIDYVCHEMGHQWGANHTQNNNCNRNTSTAMEPGSASTIMGYAGICSPNVQSNSDNYFHGVSVAEINNYITNAQGNNCDLPVPWNNGAPTITPQGDYTIPASTPFVLNTIATDPDGDPLSYLWEQWDPEVGSMPPAPTNTQGPMFRSLDPVDTSARVFPNIQAVANGTSPTWEVLPSVTRTMDFRATVFDDHMGMAGCSDEENVLVDVDGGSGPFEVLSPNIAGIEWNTGTAYEVTWDVAGTASAPVNATEVDIYLSRDGGITWPVLLAGSVPNDGSETVEVPLGATENARIVVAGTDNIFFDMSDEDFTIINSIFNLSVNPQTEQFCDPGPGSEAGYVVSVSAVAGFEDPVTLSITDAPAGITVLLPDNVLLPGEVTTMRVQDFESLSEGRYEISIEGTSGTISRSVTVNLDIVNTSFTPTLISPPNNAQDVSVLPDFEWTGDETASDYDIQIASDAGFTDIIQTISGVLTNSYSSTDSLAGNSTYFWRVRMNSSCHTGPWSQASSFTTREEICILWMSADVPKVISSSGANSVTSTIIIGDSGNITEVEVIDLEGNHTWVSDLVFTVESPGGTAITLFGGICGSLDNWDLNFDDDAPAGDIDCPPTTGNTYRPVEPLSLLDNEEFSGTWTLTVADQFNQDGGALDSWGLRICTDNYSCGKRVTTNAAAGPGSFAAALECAMSGDTIIIDPSLSGSTLVLDATIDLAFDIAIINLGAEPFTIDAGVQARAFEIAPGIAVELDGIHIRGGTANNAKAILNNGSLRLRDVSLLSPDGSGIALLDNLGTIEIEGNCDLKR